MKSIILAFCVCTWRAVSVLGQTTCVDPAVANGQPVGKLKQVYSPGETHRFVCDGSYGFVGTHYALCDNGSWIVPACKPLDDPCAAPNVPNGKPKGKLSASYPTGSTVRFVCDRGYEIEGTHFALCEVGTWRLPVCKLLGRATCGAPATPNAQPVGELKQVYRPGETLRFVCDSGYGFDGPRYALCEDGTWNLPVCEFLDAPCSAPSVPHGKPERDLAAYYPTGSAVRFVCDRGFEINTTHYALCDAGTWRLPACKPTVTCPRPAVDNARPEEELESFYTYGETVRFRCNRLYIFEGTDTAECLDGQWTLPVCKDITLCSAPTVPNARPVERLMESYQTAQDVMFICDSGYKFAGPSFAFCLSGKWLLPECVPST